MQGLFLFLTFSHLRHYQQNNRTDVSIIHVQAKGRAMQIDTNVEAATLVRDPRKIVVLVVDVSANLCRFDL